MRETYTLSNISYEENSPLLEPVDSKKGTDVTSVKSLSSDFSDEEDDPNPFVDPTVAAFYRNLYRDSEYECRHIFDPEFKWSRAEEKNVVAKLDAKIAFFACVLFVGLQIDRGNLQQAIADDLLTDLGLTTDDYNAGNTIFLVCFLLGELPSLMVSKWVGVDRFIPMQMILWLVVASLQCFLTGKRSFYATRALTAFLQSGLIPELVVMISAYYKSSELPMRLLWFWTTLSLVQILSLILAAGILQMRGLFGWEGWRYLFLIEGLILLVIGCFSKVMLVPSAVETKLRFYPNGWWNERETKIIVNRVLRDDPSKGDMNNRQGVSLSQFWGVLVDYDLWPVYVVGLFAYVPAATVNNYMNLTMRRLGWTTAQTNLLLVPHNILHIFFLLYITKFSERVGQRALVGLAVPLYQIPLLVLLNFWLGANVDAFGTWILCTFVVGAPYIHAICVSWVSRNSGSIKTRSVSAAIYNIFVQLGGVMSSNIYREEDGPLYRHGNRTILSVAVGLVPLLLAVKAYYVWRNKGRDAIWLQMDADERERYIKETKEKGNKRLNFRFDS